jgi:hypothetical protein
MCKCQIKRRIRVEIPDLLGLPIKLITQPFFGKSLIKNPSFRFEWEHVN